MKIAVPLDQNKDFSPHWGGSSCLAVYEANEAARTVDRKYTVMPADAEPCAWPPRLASEGVSLVLAGGMGRGAIQAMKKNGVRVLLGVPAGDPDALVAAYLSGDLRAGENACEGGEHGHGQHQHAHGHAHGHGHGHCGCSH